MQVLVMYYSRTGNTKNLAQTIAQGVQRVEGVKCVVKRTADITQQDLLDANGIIAGSPAYFGSMASELKELFDRFVGIRSDMQDKVGAAFATGADPSGGKETTLISIIQAMLIYGMVVVGDPLDASGHYGVAGLEEIDAETTENAAKLGARVANVVKKLHS